MNTSPIAQLLLRRVAAELDTDLEHLDPKDVMRYDREVYDACYTEESNIQDKDVPTVGACVVSMCHVLDRTSGVLTPDLLLHLRGILRYLAAAEEAEVAVYRSRARQ